MLTERQVERLKGMQTQYLPNHSPGIALLVDILLEPAESQKTDLETIRMFNFIVESPKRIDRVIDVLLGNKLKRTEPIPKPCPCPCPRACGCYKTPAAPKPTKLMWRVLCTECCVWDVQRFKAESEAMSRAVNHSQAMSHTCYCGSVPVKEG